MPPASRLPSKKRRASSASGSMDEVKTTTTSSANNKEDAKEILLYQNNSQAKTKQAESSHDNPPPSATTGMTTRNKISPSRLPSKKRKSSHDSSSQQSACKSLSAAENNNIKVTTTTTATTTRSTTTTTTTQEAHDKQKGHAKENAQHADGEDPNKHEQKNEGSQPRRCEEEKKNDTTAAQSRKESSPERTRSRRNSLDSLLGHAAAVGMRKDSGDSSGLGGGGGGGLSPVTSPIRKRARARTGSYTSIDSAVRRLRSGSTNSMDDPFLRRKFSQDFLEPLAPRKGSHDTSLTSVKLDILMDLPPPPPPMETTININPKIGEYEMAVARPRTNSTASLVNEGLPGSTTDALEHLNALADDAKPAAKKRRDSTDDHSSAAETFASSGHRVLMEAIKLTGGAEGEISSKEGSQEANFPARGRLESWSGGGSGRDRFESLGSVLEANAFASRGRDRLESWGGMSDLSANFGASGGGGAGSSAERGMSSAAAVAAAAAEAVANELTGGAEDFSGLGLFEDSNRQRASSIPSRISLGRDRFNSIASFSEASFLPEGAEVTIDLNLSSIVQAAMASVGDLAELAGIVETVAAVGMGGEGREVDASEGSSVASPMIGATLEGVSGQRPRSASTSSKLSVDYEALAAAVDAAQAAAGNIDLDSLGLGKTDESTSTDGRTRKDGNRRWRRQLPLKRGRTASEESEEDPASGGAVSEKEMARIRKRARMAAAGKDESTNKTPSSSRKKKSVPIKKRVKRQNSSPPQPDEQQSASPQETPRVSNKAIAATDEMPDVPISSSDKNTAKGQASQKWDSMFDALLGYIEERRQEETVDFSEEEKKDWSWDGNVPTTHKTPDGKALGRWVNNQRSAKAKGTLKEEREDRLVNAGLKWSVMASNSWNETLEELRNYIKEQTKDGKEWDGNVPTHYQIKAKNGKFNGEDKNLGRWVNRQRSLYQAGRLREDRRRALEKIGLKWSMLASTSWDSMFETLLQYIQERKTKEGAWDGNVPANYRTMDNPPRALGRWINRQRSAYTKRKLKPEYVEKLNKIGLKWSVHEKHIAGRALAGDDEDDDDGETKDEKVAPVVDVVASNEENEKKDVAFPDKPGSSGTNVADQGAPLSQGNTAMQTPVKV